MGRTGVAVDTAVFTSLIGIHGPGGTNIRTGHFIQYRFGIYFGKLSARPLPFLMQLQWITFPDQVIESTGGIELGTPPFYVPIIIKYKMILFFKYKTI